ncbi:phospholipase A [Aliivibrio kagoshimensis]|uniref:phospholipase A n=1 Tax=Aliivibrio kagoshimensis TaxID=2910230 RepID=UPI003D0F80B4
MLTQVLALVLTAVVIAPVMAKTNKAISIYDDTYVVQTYTNNINQAVYDEAYGGRVEQLNDTEIKFQFSLSVPMVRYDSVALMLSYTQLSLWQLSNKDMSSPFRETNYKPQLFMMHQGQWPVFNTIEYGYRHQSNGGEINISRGWDMGFIAFERNNTAIEYGIQGWYASNLGDNEDIEDFIPPYEVWVRVNGDSSSLKVRTAYNFDTDKGHVEIGYTYALSKFLDIYAQVWEGYGESLIDYNHKQTRLGIGLTLSPSIKVML